MLQLQEVRGSQVERHDDEAPFRSTTELLGLPRAQARR